MHEPRNPHHTYAWQEQQRLSGMNGTRGGAA
jgi:hypothetical protein